MGIEDFQFQKGQEKIAGSGRRTGSRNKLSSAFLEAFAADFEEHGAQTIKIVRMENPEAYLKVAAHLMPAAFDNEIPPVLHIITGVPRYTDEPATPQLPHVTTPIAPKDDVPALADSSTD